MAVRHIGIVGCSAEGAALCYRTLCSEGPRLLGAYAHPPVTMHTPSLADYVTCLHNGDWGGVARLMLTSAEALARAGAEFLICPDNTVHQAFDEVAPRSPLPWLHIAEVAAAEAAARNYTRLGVLGTRWLVDGPVYADALSARGIDCVRPDAGARDAVSRIIMDELVYGRFEPASVARLRAAIGELRRRGCDGVVLACTELPLVLDDDSSPLPTLDSTRLLAHAALRHAAGGRGRDRERRSDP